MSRPVIVIPDPITMSSSAHKKIASIPNLTYYDDVPADEQSIIERIKDAEVVTANYIDLTASIIDAAPKLKCIVVPAVGYEWVDYKYAASKGIKVSNCPTHNSHAVAEHAIALLFAVCRELRIAQDSLENGEWTPKTLVGTEVQGKKLGLVGYGNIGKNVETMAKGLGMEVTYVNSKSSDEELKTLLKESDVVIACLALNDTTKRLLNEQRLQLMKPSCIFINVARGAIVDQNALIDLLRSEKIAGAGLDVFDDEPMSGDAPSQAVELAKLPNVIATPHIAYNTAETAERLGEELYATITSAAKGNPINIVN